MKEATPPGEVNEDLRRSLAATLRLVEKGLDDLLEKRGREGILYRVQDDLPETSRQRIQCFQKLAGEVPSSNASRGSRSTARTQPQEVGALRDENE